MTQRMPLAAVWLMLIGMPLIPLGDTAGKLLASEHDVNPAFIAWSRFALGAILAGLLLKTLPPARLFADWRIWLRGALISLAILSILTALRTEPIANVFGAFFIGPAISYLLSIWLLGERLIWTRVFLVLVGFLGVLMVVQPSPNMSFGLLFAVLAGCFYGGFLTASKWLNSAAPAKHLLLSQLIIGAVLLAPFGIPAIPVWSPTIWGLTALSAASSAAGNLLLILAYALAPASMLAPLVYTQLIAATILGLVVFGTFPNALAITGLCILIATGLGAALLRA